MEQCSTTRKRTKKGRSVDNKNITVYCLTESFHPDRMLSKDKKII